MFEKDIPKGAEDKAEPASTTLWILDAALPQHTLGSPPAYRHLPLSRFAAAPPFEA